MMLLIVGSLLLIAAIFPVFAVVRVPAPWDMGLMAAKLVMMPVGAVLLMGAAGMQRRYR